MRVVFFGNNRVGLQVLQYLRAQGEQIVALVVHPLNSSRFRQELIEASGLEKKQIIEAGMLRLPETLDQISALSPEIGISVFFGRILKRPLLNLFPRECINLHPSLLPFNRGAHPNVWSILERTPAGASLHYIDDGIDTGDMIAQKQVSVDAADTGASLYRKLEDACVELFQNTWPLIRDGVHDRHPICPGEGSYHSVNELASRQEIDLDRLYTGRDLIDILRARTFPPHRGAYVRENGRKIYLELTLSSEEENGFHHASSH